MKIQIDTKAKTLKVESDINLNELMEGIKVLFPRGEWKEYKLLTNVVINNWCDPIIINPIQIEPYRPVNPWPWTYPIVTCQGENISGVYNIECVAIN